MKIMIASDIHGSRYYTSALMERLKEEKPERLVLLGDILYHGPRNDLPRDYDTKAVTAMLNALEPAPLCIRGNCDGEVDQMVLNFPVLAEFAMLYLDGRAVYLSHGHHLEEALQALHAGDILLYGHTHVPDYTLRDDILFVNPGSVSLPKNGSAHSYLLWAGEELLWKDAETGEVLRREILPV